VSVRLESANSWSVPTVLTRDGRVVDVQLDVQADALALSLQLPWSLAGDGPGGWRRRVATTIGWRLTGFWGGFEDGGIEAWHELVGAYNFLRERYPRDHIRLVLAEPGGASAFDLHNGRVSAGDITVATQVLLASGGTSRVAGAGTGEPAWGISTRLDVKVPTGSLARLGGSGGVDAALCVLASIELASWAVLHGMLHGGVVSPLSSDVPLQPRRFQFGGDLSAVFVAGGWAFVIEDRLLSALMEGGWTELDGGDDDVFLSSAYAALFRAHNQITFGLRRGPVTLSFSEDFTLGSNPRAKYKWFYDTNAPDVVLALTARFPLPW
jgi:hypothetical protein